MFMVGLSNSYVEDCLMWSILSALGDYHDACGGIA